MTYRDIISVEFTVHPSGHRRADPLEPFSPEPESVAAERRVVVLFGEVGA